MMTSKTYQMKQPGKTSTTSEGNGLVLSKAPHKMGVIGRRKPKLNRGSSRLYAMTMRKVK